MSQRPNSARPPGPRGLPLVGSAVHDNRNQFDFRIELARTYGDVVYWEFLNTPIYQLNHPDAISYVLVENNQQFIKGRFFQSVFSSFLGQGLLNSEGDEWRRQRHLIQPLFHPDRIAVYGDVVRDCTEQRVNSWTEGDRIDIYEEMMELMLEIIARALLGVDIRRDIQEIERNLDIVLTHVDSVQFHLLPSWAPTPGNRRFERAIESLDEIVYRIIDDRMSDDGGDDIVSRIISASTEQGAPIRRRELRDQVLTFLIAGHETTALVLTYTLYLIAMHPAVERGLLEEYTAEDDGECKDSTSPGKTAKGHEFTDRVLTESMRLFPPASSILREPIEDVVIDGYRIPAGSTVLLPQWVVHRDPRWYSDPLAFDPERWTTAFRRQLPALAYFPSAAGPRRYVGDRFALLEATTVLETIIPRFHLELCPETTFDVEASITTRPKHPIWMRIGGRDS